MTCSIVIATYNRRDLLRTTLASLAQIQYERPWEVIVVDNNSPDDTRAVVEEAARSFPVPLLYRFEQQQGRSAALNSGFDAASGDILVTTDDDVRVPPDWLTQIERAFDIHRCGYVAGRVLPMWQAPPPQWLERRGGRMWAVIALLDFGPVAKEFTDHAPLGVNMAITRDAIRRVGGFNTSVGRKAGTLLGQEVREWCLRARAAGIRGMYVPEIVLEHHIPADRLQKRYFRRWCYWRGISRAMMYAQTGRDMEAPERSTMDFTQVPHLFGVPRYLFRTCAQTLVGIARESARRDAVRAFDHELWIWFFAGIVAQRWKDRRRPVPAAAAPPSSVGYGAA